jgi:hypothetical protein
MNEPLIIEEQPMDPELARLFERAERNLLWFNEHAMELEVFKRYRGRFVAVSEGEMFVGDSRQEVERLAREKHPDDCPHVQYIPREKVYRIYACQRQVASFFITAKDETRLPVVPTPYVFQARTDACQAPEFSQLRKSIPGF